MEINKKGLHLREQEEFRCQTWIRTLREDAKRDSNQSVSDIFRLNSRTEKLRYWMKQYKDILEEKKYHKISVNTIQDDRAKFQNVEDNAQKEISQAALRVSR